MRGRVKPLGLTRVLFSAILPPNSEAGIGDRDEKENDQGSGFGSKSRGNGSGSGCGSPASDDRLVDLRRRRQHQILVKADLHVRPFLISFCVKLKPA